MEENEASDMPAIPTGVNPNYTWPPAEGPPS